MTSQWYSTLRGGGGGDDDLSLTIYLTVTLHHKANHSENKVGEAGSLQQNLPPEAQKTPHGTVNDLQYVFPLQFDMSKSKKPKTKQQQQKKKGRKSTWKAQRNKQPDT